MTYFRPNENRTNLRFLSDDEKSIHKKLSSIKYGEKIRLDKFDYPNIGKKEIELTVKKSACYNCINLKIKWSKCERYCEVNHEL